MQQQSKPPEYWTEENTAAWTTEQWKGQTQGEWGRKYQHGDVIPKARLSAPPTPETMAQWRLNDPRESNYTFYDGKPYPYFQPLRVKKPRARKVA
jgi:hypothetical protein